MARDLELRIPRALSSFAGIGGTQLWPHWVFLRALGLAYLLFFAGYCTEGAALIGTQGLYPADQAAIPGLRQVASGILSALGPALAVAGFAAAVALVANLRSWLALAACVFLQLILFSLGPRFFLAPLDLPLFLIAAVGLATAPGGGGAGERGALVVLRTGALAALIWVGVGGRLHTVRLPGVGSLYPTIVEYWLAQLPESVGRVTEHYLLPAAAVSLAVAALAFRRARLPVVVLLTAFEALSAASAHSGWLNVTAFALVILLLEDEDFARVTSRRAPRPGWSPPGRATTAGVLLFTLLVAAFFIDRGGSHMKCPHHRPGLVHLETGAGSFGNTRWRELRFRDIPQASGTLCPLLGTCFSRFELLLQEAGSCEDEDFLTHLARGVFEGRSVVALFGADPGLPPNESLFMRFPVETFSYATRGAPAPDGSPWRRVIAGNALFPLKLNKQTGLIEHVAMYNGVGGKPAH